MEALRVAMNGFAAVDGELIGLVAVMIPVVALFIPIVGMLTRHQKQMAELYRNKQGLNQANPEVMQLRGEIQELRERINQQTIAIDNLVSMQHALTQRTAEPSSIQLDS